VAWPRVDAAPNDFSIRFFHGRLWQNEIALFNGFIDEALAQRTQPSI
jgi:hypothetical protein